MTIVSARVTIILYFRLRIVRDPCKLCRYLSCHLRSTLTVCRQGKVGQNLKAKLKNYLMPKCYPIFYDSNINSPGVVRLNIYQAFLICAMKFICHLSNLSILPRFKAKFCMNAIETSLRYENVTNLFNANLYCIYLCSLLCFHFQVHEQTDKEEDVFFPSRPFYPSKIRREEEGCYVARIICLQPGAAEEAIAIQASASFVQV